MKLKPTYPENISPSGGIISRNLIFIIVFIAAFFRFWQIAALPGGLFPDEAANGLDVNSILQGDLEPFYERGNGREALFFYALAVAVAVLGRGPWQHHIVSASFGLAAIIVSYFLIKRLFNKNVALLATFFMAVSSYAVTLNRTAFRANSAPLLGVLTLLFLVKFFQAKDKKEKVRSALGTGICLGLGFYTYISFRMMIPLLVILLSVILFANRGRVKKICTPYLEHLSLFFLAFLGAFAWLGFYFFTHPGTFVGRAGQVSIFSKDLSQGAVFGTFLEVLKKTLLGFFTTGDLNWRHNVSGFPFLDPFLSPFFSAGVAASIAALVIVLYQARHKKIDYKIFNLALVGLWFWLMLIPEITTAEGIPHGLRLVGIIPSIFILSAFAVDLFWQRLKQFSGNTKYVLAVFFFAGIFFYNFILYFVVAAYSPDYHYAFRSDLTAVSQYLNQRNSRSSTYLSLDKFSDQTVEYLTTETKQPYILLVPEKTFEIKLAGGDQVIFTQSSLFDRIKFIEHHPNAKLIKTEKNKLGEITMLVYEQP